MIRTHIGRLTWRPRRFRDEFAKANPDFIEKHGNWESNIDKVIRRAASRINAHGYHRAAIARTFGWTPDKFADYLRTGELPSPSGDDAPSGGHEAQRLHEKALPVIDEFLDNPHLFEGKRIFVIGDMAFDRSFLCQNGSATGHAQHGQERQLDMEDAPDADDHGVVGASNNCCLLAHSLGASAALLTVVGNDEEGRLTQDRLVTQQSELQRFESLCLPLSSRVQTITRLRYFVWNKNNAQWECEFRVNKEPDVKISEAEVETEIRKEENIAWIKDQLSRADAILLNDTEKGFLCRGPVELLARLITFENESRRQARKPRLCVLVDPKNDWRKFVGLSADFMKGNHREACRSIGRPELRLDAVREALTDATKRELRDLAVSLHHRFQQHFRRIVITLGPCGALLLEPGKHLVIPTHFPAVKPKEFFAATHCGDMFATALVLATITGHSPRDGIAFANYVGSLQCSKRTGVRICSKDIIEDRNLENWREQLKLPDAWDRITVQAPSKSPE